MNRAWQESCHLFFVETIKNIFSSFRGLKKGKL